MMAPRHTLLFLILLIPVGALRAGESAEQQLKSFLTRTHALVADFKQVSLDQYGNPAQTSFGKFYLRRPGHFRWQYQRPFVQEILSKDSKIWFYDADLEQLTIKSLDDSLGVTPALLLSGKVNLDEHFTLQNQGRDEDMSWIKLSPKNEESGFKYIMLGLNNGSLAGMELSDNFGQLTRIYFSNMEINPSLADSTFQITLPEGVDVMGEE